MVRRLFFDPLTCETLTDVQAVTYRDIPLNGSALSVVSFDEPLPPRAVIGVNHNQMMTGSYDPLFVVLSVLIASLASYAALDLAGRVRSAGGKTRFGWLTGGATVMGLGIWSMHFVAMLAFHLPVPIAYEEEQMLLSVGFAIGASLLALIVVSRAELRRTALVAGGVLMGGAIAGMHYIGMASMAVGIELSYSAPIVTLSIVIAIVASLVALYLAFSFRSDVSDRGRLLKSLSAVVMGVAIAGMHYTAMTGVSFIPAATPQVSHVVATDSLAVAVVVGTLVMITLALIGAVIDRNVQSKDDFTRRLTEQAAELTGQVEESRRLSARLLSSGLALEEMNEELQQSLEYAETARLELTAEHAAYSELQGIAQQEAVKARWLEGVAEATRALAHEVNNPLTALLMNAEFLEEGDKDQATEIAEIQAAALRIAGVVKRMATVANARSVAYVGESRMVDLSPEEPE
jgi:NO-binding membrane sensor protein with MHYT domain